MSKSLDSSLLSCFLSSIQNIGEDERGVSVTYGPEYNAIVDIDYFNRWMKIQDTNNCTFYLS